MSIVGRLVLGLVARLTAGRLHASTEGALFNRALGIVGAFVGGFLFLLIEAAFPTDFNLHSTSVAIVGIVVVFWFHRTVTGWCSEPVFGRVQIGRGAAQAA